MKGQVPGGGDQPLRRSFNGLPESLAFRKNVHNCSHTGASVRQTRDSTRLQARQRLRRGAATEGVSSAVMQTRYLLVASLVTGLAILIAAAVWMATRL